VPVLITNYKKDDTTPNEPYDLEKSNLFRRFFVYDTISGIEASDGFKNLANAKVVRYASKVRLAVELDPENEEKIIVPLLSITYEEMKTNLITEDTNVKVSYLIEYYQSGAGFLNTTLILLIISQVLILCIVIIKVVYFCRANPPTLLGAKFRAFFTFRLVYFVCDTWANYSFYVGFFVTFYWFIMYKMQDYAYLLLPNAENSGAYAVFEYFFYAVLASKTVAIILQIVYQATADVLIIDWEKPSR